MICLTDIANVIRRVLKILNLSVGYIHKLSKLHSIVIMLYKSYIYLCYKCLKICNNFTYS